MKIGMITDSLGGLSFDEMLKASAELGLEMLEFACGNWSSAPHVNLDEMLESESARKNFLAKVAAHGLTISALNCSGNPLHPGNKGQLHHDVTLKTFKLAKLLKIDRIVMMSGLPGGPGDANPNWIVTDWPPECLSILQYQWDEMCLGGVRLSTVPIGISSRSVEVAQRHGRQPVRCASVAQDHLSHELGSAIGIDRLLPFGFDDGQSSRYAVGCAAAGEDDGADIVGAHRLEQGNHACDVVAIVECRLPVRLADISKGGKIDHGIRFMASHHFVEGRSIVDVAQLKRAPFCRPAVTGAKIVIGDGYVSRQRQCLACVGADIAGTPRHEDSHYRDPPPTAQGRAPLARLDRHP